MAFAASQSHAYNLTLDYGGYEPTILLFTHNNSTTVDWNLTGLTNNASTSPSSGDNSTSQAQKLHTVLWLLQLVVLPGISAIMDIL
jgi:hypothetical protein